MNVAVPKNIAGSLIQSLLSLIKRFPLISAGFDSCSLKKRVRKYVLHVHLREKSD